MTDDELIEDMRKTRDALKEQGNDDTLTARELRLSLRLTVQLIDRWIAEIPATEDN